MRVALLALVLLALTPSTAAAAFFITDFDDHDPRLALDGMIDVSWRVEATGADAVAEQFVRVMSPGVRQFRRVPGTDGSPARVPVRWPGSYCYNVFARSVTGRTASTLSPCVTVPHHARQLRRSAGWSVAAEPSMYRSSGVRATSGARTIVARTVIRWAYVVATTCPSCGSIDVYLDGELVRRVSLRSTTMRSRVPIVLIRTGTNRLRTLRLMTVDARPVTIEGVALTKH